MDYETWSRQNSCSVFMINQFAMDGKGVLKEQIWKDKKNGNLRLHNIVLNIHTLNTFDILRSAGGMLN